MSEFSNKNPKIMYPFPNGNVAVIGDDGQCPKYQRGKLSDAIKLLREDGYFATRNQDGSYTIIKAE